MCTIEHAMTQSSSFIKCVTGSFAVNPLSLRINLVKERPPSPLANREVSKAVSVLAVRTVLCTAVKYSVTICIFYGKGKDGEDFLVLLKCSCVYSETYLNSKPSVIETKY